MPDYKNSKIYKLTCDDPELFYYGATTQKLCRRLAKHKSNYKCETGFCKSRLLFEAGNVKIELVENCEFDDIEQLNAREAHYIRNNKCVNKQIPGRTKKQWKQDNKEKVKEQNKKYREKNKDKIKEWREENKEYYKEYYEKNKEKQKQYRERKKQKID